MKKILYIIGVMLAVSSCTKTDEFQNPNNGDGEVQFTAGTPTTRVTADSEWQADDRIGVFAGSVENTQYKIKVDNSGEMEYVSGDKIYAPKTGSMDYYAYYPYGTVTNNKLSVDLTTNQKPLVYAKEENKSGESVQLRFNHQLVKLNLTLTAGGGDIENLAGVGTVTLKGANAKGQFDIKTGLWDEAKTQKADIPITIASSGTSKTVTVYVMQTNSPNTNVSVIISAGGKQFGWQPTTANWDAGQTYDYNITVGKAPTDPITSINADFKTFLLGQNTSLFTGDKIDANSDGEISYEEAKAVTMISTTKYLDDSNNSPLTSIEGLEHFTSLKELSLSNNRLETIDVSKNKALETLIIQYNKVLKELDVSNNENLKMLLCIDNSLTKLNVSKNKMLERLECGRNQLTTLNVTQNTNLGILKCDENQLTELDISENSKLYQLWCQDNNLTSLELHGRAYSGIMCYGNRLTTLDISGLNGSITLESFDPTDQKTGNITVTMRNDQYRDPNGPFFYNGWDIDGTVTLNVIK